MEMLLTAGFWPQAVPLASLVKVPEGVVPKNTKMVVRGYIITLVLTSGEAPTSFRLVYTWSGPIVAKRERPRGIMTCFTKR